MPDCVTMFVPVNKCFPVRTPVAYQDADLPLSNVSEPEMWTFGSVAPESDAKLKFCSPVFGDDSTNPIQVVSLYKHNYPVYMRFGITFQWRVILSTTSAAITTTDPTYDESDLTIVADSGLLDPYNETDFLGSEDGGYINHLTHVFDQEYLASSVFIFIYGQRTGAGYHDVDLSELGPFIFARMFGGAVVQPPFSASFSSGIVHHEETPSLIAESGAEHTATRRIRRRGLKLQFDGMTKDGYLQSVYGPVIVKRGKAKDFLTVLAPDDPDNYYYEVCLGKLEERSVQTLYTGFDQLSTSFTVKESI